MTSEGEQQEAVCWTCTGDPRDGDGYHAYNCPERTGRIPAPVVPSDEHDPFPSLWAMKPPTPLQDAVKAYITATDDRVEALRAYIARLHRGENADQEFAVVCEAEERHHNALLDMSSALVIESAIREPYEELVKALLTSSIAQSVLANFKSRGVPGVCDVLERDWGSDESDVAEFCAALTNIEESLGGRKDG